MNAEEIVELLQYRRHDLVNDMQIIHGYVSMDMLDRAQEKVEEFLRKTEQERKLYMLKAPLFTICIEKFRMHQEIFTLTYDIHEMIELQDYDECLTKICNTLLEIITTHFNHEHMHVLQIDIGTKGEQHGYVQITVDSIHSRLYDEIEEQLTGNNYPNLVVTYLENKVTCMVQID
ncbi:MAG TPA: Spo0B domain-containing protein [Bacillota bacterium]|nr:Spo0B domain-containing protein [Bacillota bacterium]